MRRIHFIRPLGSGAVGTVYLASLEGERGFSREVAVKVILTGKETEFLTRMRDEARLLGLLRDDNVLKVLELIRIAGRDGVVMEFVEGVDLQTVIGTAQPVPARALAEMGSAIAGTLFRAHNAVHPSTGAPLNVIHRDVKPGNVMVSSRGSVKLLDFGVARAHFESRESHTGQLVLGTLNYMAPEYILTGKVDTSADIYGLGIVLWEAAAARTFGQPKIRRASLERKVADALTDIEATHAELVPVIRAMLSWEPSSRPGGDQVEQELLAAADTIRGTSLRSWASKAVPPLLAQRAEHVEDPVGLAGESFELSDNESDTDSNIFQAPAGPAPALPTIDFQSVARGPSPPPPSGIAPEPQRLHPSTGSGRGERPSSIASSRSEGAPPPPPSVFHSAVPAIQQQPNPPGSPAGAAGISSPAQVSPPAQVLPQPAPRVASAAGTSREASAPAASAPGTPVSGAARPPSPRSETSAIWTVVKGLMIGGFIGLVLVVLLAVLLLLR